MIRFTVVRYKPNSDRASFLARGIPPAVRLGGSLIGELVHEEGWGGVPHHLEVSVAPGQARRVAR